MTFLMKWVDPKDHMLKILCQYLYYWLRYRLNKEKRPSVTIPTHLKLTEVPRVINDVLYVLGSPQGSYPKSFVLIFLLLADIWANQEIRPIVIMPTHPKLTQVPRVIHEGSDVLGRPQGSYAESFVALSIVLADI